MAKTTKNTKMVSVWILAVAFVSLTPMQQASAESPDDLIVFVHRTSSVADVDLADLRAVFLKKRTRWNSGGKVIPVHAKEGTALREAFRAHVLEMKSYEEQSYWQNQQIRLGLDPPATLSNTQKAVFKLKNAVSYCFRKDLHNDIVKVVKIIPR